MLHLHSARVSHTPSKHMLVVVRKAQRHWFQREDFLFLANRPPVSFGCAGSRPGCQEKGPAWCALCPLVFLTMTPLPSSQRSGTTKHSRLQLLPEPELAGRVYVHGYLVAKMDDLPCYGLNILCSGKKLKDLGVGRDRNSVKTSETTRFVPEVRAFPGMHWRCVLGQRGR